MRAASGRPRESGSIGSTASPTVCGKTIRTAVVRGVAGCLCKNRCAVGSGSGRCGRWGWSQMGVHSVGMEMQLDAAVIAGGSVAAIGAVGVGG